MTRKGIAATFLAFSFIGILWAVAMPLNAGPDEDQHMIWAASSARLQFEPGGTAAEPTLRAPAVLYVEHCLQFEPATTADCQDRRQPTPHGDIRNLPVTRGVPYYLTVGLPSLVTSTKATAYLMRLAHIGLTAALLTLGVWNMAQLRPSPGSIALTTVAFTPMAAFLIGMVNPSGPAIASGFAMWTSGLYLLPSAPLTLRRVALCALPVVTFLLVRQDALIWVTCIVLTLAGHRGVPRLSAALKRPLFRLSLLVAALGATGSYVVGGDHLVGWLSRAARSGEGGTASSSFGVLTWYAQQMIGQLGWLDVTMPRPILFGWYSLIAVALFIALAASRRAGVSAVAVLLVAFAAAFLFDLLVRHRFYFQGRYALPFVLGIPMIAGAAVRAGGARHLVPARAARAMVWAVAVMSSVAFAVALRRYTVGHRGPWPDMLFDPRWDPPLPSWALVAAYAALMATLATFLGRAIGRCEAEPQPRTAAITAR